MVHELERVLRVCDGFLCSMSATYGGAVQLWQQKQGILYVLPTLIEVGRSWRCLVLLQVTSMSSVLLSLS